MLKLHLIESYIVKELIYLRNFFTIYDYKKVNEIEDIDEQIELVRQVIDKVILDRPLRNILNIEIHNKVDNEVEKLAYDTFRHVKIC